MTIIFTTESAYTADDLHGFLNTEGVGFETDSSSAASLDLAESGPIWVTFWSGFTYQLIGHENGRDRWEYRGAQNGFLAQTLLFPLPDVRIVSVEGTYGRFQGEDALEEYGALKEPWFKKVWAIEDAINGLYGERIMNTPDGASGSIAAALWSVGQKIDPGFHLRPAKAEEARAKAAAAQAKLEEARSVLRWVRQVNSASGDTRLRRAGRSGCDKPVYEIVLEGVKRGEYFGGDRCNPASFSFDEIRFNEDEMNAIT